MFFFIKDVQEWELVYIFFEIDVVREIIEDVKRNFNIIIKGRY